MENILALMQEYGYTLRQAVTIALMYERMNKSDELSECMEAKVSVTKKHDV